jgi:hypothetical protein
MPEDGMSWQTTTGMLSQLAQHSTNFAAPKFMGLPMQSTLFLHPELSCLLGGDVGVLAVDRV